MGLFTTVKEKINKYKNLRSQIEETEENIISFTNRIEDLFVKTFRNLSVIMENIEKIKSEINECENEVEKKEVISLFEKENERLDELLEILENAFELGEKNTKINLPRNIYSENCLHHIALTQKTMNKITAAINSIKDLKKEIESY